MSVYATGLLLRTHLPGADAAHKLVLMVLGEMIATDHHPDFDELALAAQMHKATAYRKVADLTAAGLLKIEHEWINREKFFRWTVNVALLRALHGDRGEGEAMRAARAVEAGFARGFSPEAKSEKASAVQDKSQSANPRHNSPPAKSPPAKSKAAQDISQESQKATYREEDSKLEKGGVGGSDPKKRKRRIIPDDCPSPADREAALAYWRKHRPELIAKLAITADQFRDHHVARGSIFADWAAAWRTWFRRAVEYAGGSQAIEWTDKQWLAALKFEAKGDPWDSRWPPRDQCPDHLDPDKQTQGSLF